LFTRLFGTSGFPRLWDFGSTTSDLGWLHVMSDLGMCGAYLAIACALSFFVLRKKGLPFRAALWLFTAFLLACGISQLMEAVVFWLPAYRLAAFMKLVAAMMSWASLIALLSIVPQALAMRSPQELERELGECKRIEVGLRESEQVFRQMAESIREMFWMQDGGWKRTLYVSPAYEEVWGRTCQSLYENPRSWIDSVHPDDRELVMVQLEQQLGGITTDTEFRVARPDGSLRWVRCHAFPIRDDAGEVYRVAGLAEDITERKLAQEALRESEERFRGTFENAAVGIAHMDSQNRCLRANEKLGEILGYPSSELVGKTLQEVVHPDDLEPNLALFDPLVQGKLPSFSMEKRFIRKDGASVWTQVTASVQRDAAAQPAFCIAMVQDISERKRLEAELSQAHDRLELAVRGSNVRIWDLDMPDGEFQNGRMYSVNFWEHLGYGPETQAETATALSLLHPDDLEPAMRAVQAALSGETKAFEAEFRVRHKDGTYRWMLSRGAVVRNAAGVPVRFIGSDVDTTDLKRAEAALRESEQRFGTFVDHASDAFFLLDQRMVILDVNRRACQSLGYTRDELVGMTPTHLNADITPADLEDIERRLNLGESVAFESRHRRKDGTVFPVEIRAQAFSEGDRHLTVALARDVTDRKRAEEALRLSEQRYRSLVEATAAVVWTMAANGLAESEQPSWSAFTGQSTDQLAGWGWLDAIHPDDRAHTFEDWSTAVATCSLYQVEYRVRRHDGEYRNMLTRGVPILAGDGEIREWFGTCVDITDLKRAEEALRESEERFRGTFENAAVGIAHKDVTGRFLRVNETFCDIVGYTRDELLTMTWQDITYPGDLAAIVGQYNPLMRGESLSFSLEKRYLRKDHSIVWVDVSVSLQRDAAGLPAYAIAMVQDISERKRLEGELRQAKESAESANRAKDEFLANVSHEIRTPMNAILGMTELALDTPLTDDQRQYLKTVRSAAESLLGIINDLLDFSKIEAGKLELDLADFSLRAALGDTLRALAIRAHKKGLELVSHVQSDVPDALVGDAGRLRQSLLNLIGNAIKFTAEGEVVVRVEVASDSVPEGEVGLRFTVTDTGIGIPPEKQETIFRAFEQEDTSTTRKYGGTGLGLTIAARLVALMGGRITVDSQPGRGSTFSFAARFGLQPHQPESVASSPPVLLRNLRALIVDDNVTNRRILEEWLRGWQMEPAAVGDGLAALNALWHAASVGRPYPLMLLDARMPDTDGLALAAKLREHNELSSTRIILLTSGDRPGDLARSRQLGINANLLKPVQQEELLEMIYQVMSRTNGDATEAAQSAPSQEPIRGLGPNLKPLRILIAEDNEFNAQHLERLLVRGHHSVRLANNGREALALLGIDAQKSGADSLIPPGPSPPSFPAKASSATSDFDLLLLDLHMPELDGFQVVQALREREQVTGGHLPVIALTARSRNEDRERCLAAGMDDFITKPVRSVELFAAIERVLFDHKVPPPILPDTGDSTSLLDPVVLLGACGDDAEGLRAMGQGFEVYLPLRLAEVADALRNENAPGLRMAAHKLCGLLSAFSTVAGGVASSLEDHAASGRLEECRPLVEQLEVMARQLVQEMDGLSIESLREQMRAAGDTKSH